MLQTEEMITQQSGGATDEDQPFMPPDLSHSDSSAQQIFTPVSSPPFTPEHSQPNTSEAGPQSIDHIETKSTFGRLSQADASHGWTIQFGDWGVIRLGQGINPQVIQFDQYGASIHDQEQHDQEQHDQEQHDQEQHDQEQHDQEQHDAPPDDTHEVIQLQSKRCIYCPTDYSDHQGNMNEDATGVSDVHPPLQVVSLIAWLADVHVAHEAPPSEVDDSSNVEWRIPRAEMTDLSRRSQSI
jgi:hypothetical protein